MSILRAHKPAAVMFLLDLDAKCSTFIHHHKTVHWSIFLKIMSVHLSHEDLKSQVSWLECSLSKVPGYCIPHISFKFSHWLQSEWYEPSTHQIGLSWVQVHSYSIKVQFYTKLHSVFESFVGYGEILKLTLFQKQPPAAEQQIALCVDCIFVSLI